MTMALNALMILGILAVAEASTDWFSMVSSIFNYVGVGIGGTRLMQKVDAPKPWLFWVPVANMYAYGYMADRQAELCEGKTTNYRKKLLGWTIATIGTTVLAIAAVVYLIVTLMALGIEIMADEEILLFEDAYDAVYEAVLPPMLVLFLTALLVLAAAIVCLVYYFISLNRIYKLFAPDHSTLFTVLSIFVPLATPIIFLVLSGREPVTPCAAESYEIPAQEPEAPAAGGDDFYTL